MGSIVSYLVLSVIVFVFPYFFFTMTILIFIAFVFINDISKEETRKADRISSSYLETRWIVRSGILNYPYRKRYRVSRHTNFILITQIQTSSDTVYSIAQNLRELSSSSSWIQSIYIYDKRKDMFYSKWLQRSGKFLG